MRGAVSIALAYSKVRYPHSFVVFSCIFYGVNDKSKSQV
jgi:hypothetical protein